MSANETGRAANKNIVSRKRYKMLKRLFLPIRRSPRLLTNRGKVRNNHQAMQKALLQFSFTSVTQRA